MTIDLHWKSDGEINGLTVKYLVNAVNPAQGVRLIKPYFPSSKRHNPSVKRQELCCSSCRSSSSSMSCSKTHRLLPRCVCVCVCCCFAPPVIKTLSYHHLTLSCCYSGTYHLCSPLGRGHQSKCPLWFRLNQQFQEIDWILSWFHKTFRQTN